MAEMGHTGPALALRVYAQATRRDEHQNAQLRALMEDADWANMGERARLTLAIACEAELTLSAERFVGSEGALRVGD